MKSRRSKQFNRMFNALPIDVQHQADKAYQQFKANPDHPGLEFKQVSAKGPTYSVRIGIHWRALAVQRPDHWLWFWIGPHAEYDKLLRQIR